MKKISFTALVSMVLSCVICSIAVNWVALPNGFVVTGITGLAMTAQSFTGINYALIYYGLMLLILVLTFVMLGYREVSNILFLSFLYPLVLWVLNHWTVEIILKEKLIAVMLFGVIYGVGAGITYRLGYSYGGTDTLAKILKTKVLKAVELKHILLALDGIIMAVMLLRFSLDVVAYALVGQIIYVNSMNYVIFNMGPKLYEIQIVCENSKAIESFVIHEIHKSATLSQVTGSYSGQTKTQVDCVCNSREYVQLREFIRDQGVDCFIKVFPLTHVFGQNKDFHRLSDENLVDFLSGGVVDGLPLHLPDQSGQGDGNVGKHEDGEGKYVQDLLVGRNLDLLPLAEHSQSAEEQQAQVEVDHGRAGKAAGHGQDLVGDVHRLAPAGQADH